MLPESVNAVECLINLLVDDGAIWSEAIVNDWCRRPLHCTLSHIWIRETDGVRRRGWFPGCFVSVPRSIGIEPNEGGWAWCMIAWVMRVVVWNMGFCHE